MDGTGAQLTVTRDPDGKMIRVEIPAGYTGTVRVRFAEPWFWRAAEAVSLLTLAGVAVYCLRRPKGSRTVQGEG